MSSTKSNRSTIYLSTAVPPWMKVEVARLAEESSVSMSDIQRTAIICYLNTRETAHA
jgi:hypothetical protein